MFRLAMLALVVLALGCVDTSETARPGDGSGLASAPGPDEGTPADKTIVPTTPEKAVQAYQRAMGHHNWDGCWKLLHGQTRKAYGDRAAEFVKRFNETPDGPERVKVELRLVDMGLTLNEARLMDGQMLMTGLLRSRLKNDPDGFQSFVDAECLGHQQMGRQAVVSIRVPGLLQPRQVMVRRYGVRYYIYEEPSGFVW